MRRMGSVPEPRNMSHEESSAINLTPSNVFRPVKGDSSYFIDNVSVNGTYGITITSVPEPATLALLGLGILPLLLRGRRI